jgi:hypothetical protein
VVYPNPVRHTLHLSAEGEQPIFALRMLNIQGQEVYFVRNLDTIRYAINVSGMKSGLYFLQILGVNGWSVTRVQVIGE